LRDWIKRKTDACPERPVVSKVEPSRRDGGQMTEGREQKINDRGQIMDDFNRVQNNEY